jgi:hypothetical protein
MPETSTLPQSQRFTREPWFKRVRDIDDGTLDMLLLSLMRLRRIRAVMLVVAMCAGGMLFGILHAHFSRIVLIYLMLAGTAGFGAFGMTSAGIQVAFYREARRHGLSPAAATLVLVRASRRARFLFGRQEKTLAALVAAVRDPDQST